jgi:signal transduction histidine kinase
MLTACDQAVVEIIVAAAGGTLTCEARAGGGTTFRVTLPSAGVAQVV